MIRLLLLVAFALLTCSPNRSAPVFLGDARSANTSFLLTPNFKSWCSATAISATRLLTAQHCLKGESSLWFMSREDFYRSAPAKSARLVYVNTFQDIAILETSETKFDEWIPPSCERPFSGDRVHYTHHGGGRHWTFSEGEITKYYDTAGERWIEARITIEGGSSGAGLIDERGRLIGVASWRYLNKPGGIFGSVIGIASCD